MTKKKKFIENLQTDLEIINECIFWLSEDVLSSKDRNKILRGIRVIRERGLDKSVINFKQAKRIKERRDEYE